VAEREFHEVWKRLSGPEAAPYMGIARVLLGKLKEQMRFQGLLQLWWNHVQVAPGVLVTVGSVFGHDTIQIDIEGGVEEPISEAGLLWSGLAFPAYDANYPLSPAPTFWAGKHDSAHNIWQFDTFLPENVSIENAPSSNLPTRTLLVSVVGDVPYALTGAAGDPPYTCLPGLYSGRMRRVVQHMLGAGQVPPWSSRWDNCAWLFTTTDDSEWVVQVNRDLGLQVAPLTYLGVKSGTPWKIASGNGAWTTLLTVDDMSAYFGTRELSFDLGFAANDRGTEARNLSRNDVSEYEVTHVYEWRIQITEAVDIDNNSYPSSATLTQVSDDIAWTSIGGRVRMPNGPFYSQPWEVNLAGHAPKPAGIDEFSWPIHVFYDGDIVQRFKAHHLPAPSSEETLPTPKGATEADVWLADGADYYPFIDSYPKAGTGTFALGSLKTYSPGLRFEGTGMPADAGFSWAYSDVGVDVFTLEAFGDATGKLVYMGGTGGGVVIDGGVAQAAIRTRTQLQTGQSQLHDYAVWIPFGDREAILAIERHVATASTYTHTRSVRHSHMFGSGPRVVGGNPGDSTECCGALRNGYIIQKIGGETGSFTDLPAPCDNANVYLDNWRGATAHCPVPDGSYPMPYLCSLADYLGNMANASSYDTSIGIDPPAIPVESYSVQFVGSGSISSVVDSGTELPSPAWFQSNGPLMDTSPLRAARTYSGQGCIQSQPSDLFIAPISGVDGVYLQFIKNHGLLCLWVGEPH
jgi:hypothetical protein